METEVLSALGGILAGYFIRKREKIVKALWVTCLRDSFEYPDGRVIDIHSLCESPAEAPEGWVIKKTFSHTVPPTTKTLISLVSRKS